MPRRVIYHSEKGKNSVFSLGSVLAYFIIFKFYEMEKNINAQRLDTEATLREIFLLLFICSRHTTIHSFSLRNAEIQRLMFGGN